MIPARKLSLFCNLCRAWFEASDDQPAVHSAWGMICTPCSVRTTPGSARLIHTGKMPEQRSDNMHQCAYCRGFHSLVGWTWQGLCCQHCWNKLGLNQWHGPIAHNMWRPPPRRERERNVISVKKKIIPRVADVKIEEITDGPLT